MVGAAMYWLGWELGAVEAISLSILVGSSVDYCLHLVEGYMLAGETAPPAAGLGCVSLDGLSCFRRHARLADIHPLSSFTYLSTRPHILCTYILYRT